MRVPLDRNAKARIKALATAWRHAKTITNDTFFVLVAILYDFHNSKTGACYPTRDKIAARAGVCLKTVDRAKAALEQLKLITWTRCLCRDRSGLSVNSANGYVLNDPKGQSYPTTTKTTFLDLNWSAAEAARAINEGKLADVRAIWRRWETGFLSYDEATADADAIWNRTGA
jgi:hypothetical protein